MRWTAVSLALPLLAGCGTSPRGAVAGPSPALSAAVADQLAELATLALDLDARAQPAETLYAPGAEILAEGRRRSGVPRFAGVEAGGQAVVGSTRVDVIGSMAWALLEYRWLSPEQHMLREGRATLVFALDARGRWRIVHAHSSLSN
jgi:hypothetical protein